MIEFIKKSLFLEFLINYFIRLYILLFRVNGKLKLKYQYKRRIFLIQFTNRKRYLYKVFDPNYSKKVKEFLVSNFNGYSDTAWSVCYAKLNGIFDHRYIPDDIYYDVIERRLCNYNHAFAYNDKNYYKKLFENVNVPKTLFRIINGRFYDENYIPTSIEKITKDIKNFNCIVFKPSIDSGGGKNVLIDTPASVLAFVDNLNRTNSNKINLNYIAQDCLIQHQDLAKFHSKSVNTMRIMTLRLDKEIVHLSTVLRMGRGSAKVDNQSSGGISCGIDEKTGKLKKYAYDILFCPFEKHPDSGLTFEGQQIPFFHEAVNVAKKLHDNLLYFDIVSWDLTVGSDNKVYLIEVNLTWQGLTLLQISNGPLFGEYTDKVLKYINS